MPIKNYGVWKAKPTYFKAQRRDEDPHSPHGRLEFDDGVSSRPLSSAINIKSISSDNRLVIWQIGNFQHPLTEQLGHLESGFHAIGRRDYTLGLDYFRSGVVQVNDGQIICHDVDGERNDIVDFLDPFFQTAIREKAIVYLYGEQYRQRDGIHDVHMNQGSDGGFRSSNGVFQDGGVIMEYPDGHWEAFFIAFASQAIRTTDDGQPNGPTFGKYLGSGRERARL